MTRISEIRGSTGVTRFVVDSSTGEATNSELSVETGTREVPS